MTLSELTLRSQTSFESDPHLLPCANRPDPLVLISGNDKLVVKPIWEEPISHVEGILYRTYIDEHPQYQGIYLRQEVHDRLLEAASTLPEDVRLVIRAGHRPLEVQQKELASLIEIGTREKNLNAQDALAFARTFVDDPSIKIPSHACGSAVDVELYDAKTDSLIDFGTSLNSESEKSFLHSDEITHEQKNNRILLLTTMLRVGFAPTYTEWWHYSYGDTVWAYFYNKKASLYGIIEPSV